MDDNFDDDDDDVKIDDANFVDDVKIVDANFDDDDVGIDNY